MHVHCGAIFLIPQSGILSIGKTNIVKFLIPLYNVASDYRNACVYTYRTGSRTRRIVKIVLKWHTSYSFISLCSILMVTIAGQIRANCRAHCKYTTSVVALHFIYDLGSFHVKMYCYTKESRNGAMRTFE